MINYRSSAPTLFLTAACASLALTACDRSPSTADTSATPIVRTTTDDAAAQAAAQAEADRAAELAAKEKDLVDREAAMAQRELDQEAARLDAEKAAADARKARDAAVAAKKRATSAAAGTTAASTPPVKTTAPPPPLVVPSGTQLSIGLNSEISTKTAKVGDLVHAQLQSSLMVGGKNVVPAGAMVHGTVTQVVSGSSKIGGIPTLGLSFNSMVLENGTTVPISGQLVQQGKSETARDTAKILGGAAAGAVIGHQVDDDKGSVIGGLLGGAAGTAAARKTGGEVILPAGTTITATTQAAFQADS